MGRGRRWRRWVGVVGAASAVAVLPACGAAPARATAVHGVRIQSVDWANVSVSGSVCDGSRPVQLRDGRATIAAPAAVHAITPRVTVSESHPVYGNLNGVGQDEAAVNVSCASTTGTAAGQLADLLVIYSVDSGSLRVVGTLVPPPATAAGAHVAYFDVGSGAVRSPPPCCRTDPTTTPAAPRAGPRPSGSTPTGSSAGSSQPGATPGARARCPPVWFRRALPQRPPSTRRGC